MGQNVNLGGKMYFELEIVALEKKVSSIKLVSTKTTLVLINVEINKLTFFIC